MKRVLLTLLLLAACAPPDGPTSEATATKRQAVVTPFAAGSLIIPVDNTNSDTGTLRAFGLLHRLLQANIPVHGSRWARRRATTTPTSRWRRPSVKAARPSAPSTTRPGRS